MTESKMPSKREMPVVGARVIIQPTGRKMLCESAGNGNVVLIHRAGARVAVYQVPSHVIIPHSEEGRINPGNFRFRYDIEPIELTPASPNYSQYDDKLRRAKL